MKQVLQSSTLSESGESLVTGWADTRAPGGKLLTCVHELGRMADSLTAAAVPGTLSCSRQAHRSWCDGRRLLCV